MMGRSMITPEHVRELLAAPGPDAVLVLVDGEVRISADPEGEGGLVVARRDDLLAGQTAPSNEQELRDLAQGLDAAVAELGG